MASMSSSITLNTTVQTTMTEKIAAEPLQKDTSGDGAKWDPLSVMPDPADLCECLLDTSDPRIVPSEPLSVVHGSGESHADGAENLHSTGAQTTNAAKSVPSKHLWNQSRAVRVMLRRLEDENHNYQNSHHQNYVVPQFNNKRVLRVLLRRLEDEDIGKLLREKMKKQPPSAYSGALEQSLKSHTCDVCLKNFSSLYRLQRHRTPKCPTLNRFACEVCKKVLTRHFGLLKHLLCVHKLKNKNYKIKKHCCEDCQRSFKHRHALENHRTPTCASLKRFPCKLCHYSAKRSSGLKRHQKSVHESVKYVCKQCRKTFTTEEFLRRHMQTHLKKKICPICDKSFKATYSLHCHMFVHDQSFSKIHCTLCGKKCRNNSELKKHMRKHPEKDWYFAQGVTLPFSEPEKAWSTQVLKVNPPLQEPEKTSVTAITRSEVEPSSEYDHFLWDLIEVYEQDLSSQANEPC